MVIKYKKNECIVYRVYVTKPFCIGINEYNDYIKRRKHRKRTICEPSRQIIVIYRNNLKFKKKNTNHSVNIDPGWFKILEDEICNNKINFI